jgi:hypothetical protein
MHWSLEFSFETKGHRSFFTQNYYEIIIKSHKKVSKTLNIRNLGETKGGIGAFLHKKELINIVTTRPLLERP